MDRHIVVGTAGHIDHGKTALVLALTGVDTDRWQEEKRRGITIDLGFASLPLADGLTASVVDVPGHEAFVKNMLAGATGIDLAMLVVAADEGVMPQTEEHLAILELLGITRGVPVVTKTDLVDAEWLDLVIEEVTARLETSRVRWVAPVRTAAVRGEGLDDLRQALAQAAQDLPERSADDLFRLPIDRVFALPGAGTVVTGTTWSGTVARGDSVSLLPAGVTARVRSVEVHGKASDAALPGRRTALALVGVGRDQVKRGDVVVDSSAWVPTTRLAVSAELLPSVRRPVRRRERVRVHLGTSAIMGRVVGAHDLRAGAPLSTAVLELERPVIARAGDRFVLRAASPVSTIGGGVVLDPVPDEAAVTGGVVRLVAAADRRGIEIDQLPIRLVMTRGQAARVVGDLPEEITRIGSRLVARTALERLAAALRATVREHHASHPFEAGISLQALRAGAASPPEVADSAIQIAVERGELIVEGAMVRATEWKLAQDPATAACLDRIAEELASRGWQFPSVPELEARFGVKATKPLLAVLAREGRAVSLDRDHYIDARALGEFEAVVRRALAEHGALQPADLRQATGLTRKYLIPLLEWADRSGVTRRDGDVRVAAG